MKASGTPAFIMLPLLILLLSFSCASVMASGLSAPDLSQELDLVSFLNSRPQHHDAIFAEAVQLLGSMKYSPSCNRIAATRLVTSCQSIGGKAASPGSEDYVTLEHTRSLYAARLAICELNGAGTSIPAPCSPVAVLPPQKKGLFGSAAKYKPQGNVEDAIPQQLLGSCLKSLESRPQWWTSYSNSRQNAVVICQASRIENEKEELLGLHRSVVDVTLKVNYGLEKALRMAAARSAEQQAFLHAVDAMRNRLAHELGETESHFKRVVKSIAHEIESSVNSAVTGITSVLERVHTEATGLEKDVRNVSDEIDHLQTILQTVHQETLARSEQLARSHQQDAQAQNELAISLHSSLESLLQGNVIKLFQDVEIFDASLEWLTGRMAAVIRQETEVSERLRGFETSLEKSEMKAESLRKAQVLQFKAIKAQFKAQDDMQTNMRISQALLDKTTAAAANLQAIIDETATRYRDSYAFGSFFGVSTWTICAFLFSMLSIQNPKPALAVLLIGISTYTFEIRVTIYRQLTLISPSHYHKDVPFLGLIMIIFTRVYTTTTFIFVLFRSHVSRFTTLKAWVS